jgi:hypothetical protein
MPVCLHRIKLSSSPSPPPPSVVLSPSSSLYSSVKYRYNVSSNSNFFILRRNFIRRCCRCPTYAPGKYSQTLAKEDSPRVLLALNIANFVIEGTMLLPQIILCPPALKNSKPTKNVTITSYCHLFSADFLDRNRNSWLERLLQLQLQSRM